METAIRFGVILGVLVAIMLLCILGIRFLDWYEKRKSKATRRFIPHGWFKRRGVYVDIDTIRRE